MKGLYEPRSKILRVATVIAIERIDFNPSPLSSGVSAPAEENFVQTTKSEDGPLSPLNERPVSSFCPPPP